MGRESPEFDPSPQPFADDGEATRTYQSVAAGERDVYVTVTLEGSGRGSASRQVTLQVLGPDFRADSAVVVISC